MSDLQRALRDPRPSVRLQAVMAAGTRADASELELLVRQCATEPDFFVRDMLTWALTRIPRSVVVPAVIAELARPEAQARSQALHTLSKIGDPVAWPAVQDCLADASDSVARAAWRAAVLLAPEAERPALAKRLATQLGKGDRETQLSLSRAFAGLGDEVAGPVLAAAAESPRDDERAHAAAALKLLSDPDSASTVAVELARREVALGRTRSAKG